MQQESPTTMYEIWNVLGIRKVIKIESSESEIGRILIAMLQGWITAREWRNIYHSSVPLIHYILTPSALLSPRLQLHVF